MNIVVKKREIRARFVEERKALGKTTCLSYSRAIGKRLLASNDFIAAKIIHFYLSDAVEVQTDGLIEETLKLGKRVVVPIFNKERPDISEINDLDLSHFEVDSFGIRHVKRELYKKVSMDEVDLWVIPGVAYDTMGNRMGRGKGYYDRLLQSVSGKIVGLAFELQIQGNIPFEQTDRKVDQIITENRTIICGVKENATH